MAGGMILLGVLLVYFDVATGMILFSIIQFFVNGWRVVQWRRLRDLADLLLVRRRRGWSRSRSCGRSPSCPTRPRSTCCSASCRSWSKFCRPPCGPNIEWRGVPFVTGFLTTVIQILSGVGGLLLDIFFQKSMLDRKTTNATKAVAQTFSHVAALRSISARSPASATCRCRTVRARGRCSAIGRRVAGALRGRAHDRPRLPAMDAGAHPRHQRRLSRARRLAVLARVTGRFQQGIA